jgi:hypothetical protein
LVRSLEKFDSSSPSEVVSWAYCGNINKSGLASFEAMGYDYVAADSSLFFMMDKYSGSLVLNGQSEVEDAFQLEYQVNIGSVLAWLETQKDRDVGQAVSEDVEPDISLLEIRRIDNGFNERKARLCAQKEGVSVDEYYSGHVEAVKKLLDEVGIKPSESFSELYPELIKPKSELYWFMQPKANFNFEGITYYSYEEFVKLGGLRILINKKPFDLFSEGWSFDSFQQILVNAQNRQKEKEAPKELYKTVFVERDYRTFPSTQAGRFIGLKAKVYRADGSLFEGKVSKVDDQRVWLISRSMKGELTLPFTHREVQKFEVFVQVNKED